MLNYNAILYKTFKFCKDIDLASESVARAWQKLDTTYSEPEQAAFMYTTAAQYVRDTWKEEKLRRTRELYESELSVIDEPDDNYDTSYTANIEDTIKPDSSADIMHELIMACPDDIVKPMILFVDSILNNKGYSKTPDLKIAGTLTSLEESMRQLLKKHKYNITGMSQYECARRVIKFLKEFFN